MYFTRAKPKTVSSFARQEYRALLETQIEIRFNYELNSLRIVDVMYHFDLTWFLILPATVLISAHESLSNLVNLE